MKKWGDEFNNRGQVTLFIIVAMIIIVAGVLIYIFYPKFSALLGVSPKSPSAFIQSCLEDELETAVDTLSLQGGIVTPTHYILYDNSQIQYLCYTDEYYKPCVMQVPLLNKFIENEIYQELDATAKDCFKSMKKSYEDKGYVVKIKEGEMNVELLPKRVALTFSHEVVLEKAESERYERFVVVLNNNLYELTSIASSILNWETAYGDAETTTYMTYYEDLKVEKKKQSEGSTIYVLTDRNNGNKFQFASRSYAFPPGYGISAALS